MRIHRLGVVLVATFVFATVVAGSASANRLSMSNKNFRITWAALTLAFPGSVECAVTLEGSFHSNTIRKVERSLVGHISRAIVGACANGQIKALNGTELLHGVAVGNSLPWHLQYAGFTGTLPRITGVRAGIVGASWLVEFPLFEVPCLFRSTEARPWFGIFVIEAARKIIGFRSDETAGIPVKEGFGCPEEARASGIGGVTLLGNTSTITVTLI